MDVKLGGDSEGPLSGVRVADCSTVVSGPLCGQILGDLGENPEAVLRQLGYREAEIAAVRAGGAFGA